MIVGWQLAANMRTDLVLDALRMALGLRAPGADFAAGEPTRTPAANPRGRVSLLATPEVAGSLIASALAAAINPDPAVCGNRVKDHNAHAVVASVMCVMLVTVCVLFGQESVTWPRCRCFS